MTNQNWHLDNARDIAKENPYTFYVPSDELIKMLKVGHAVRLIFVNDARTETDTMRAERMWVEITHIDGNDFIGKLDNKPYENKHLNLGDEIHFKDYHIMDFYDNDLTDPVPSLAQYWDRCWTTSAIIDKTAPIGYICRTSPCDDKNGNKDSGWQILSGDETQEYMDDPDTIQCVALGVLLNIDDSFIHLLSSYIGTAFEKNAQGEWVKIEFNYEEE